MRWKQIRHPQFPTDKMLHNFWVLPLIQNENFPSRMKFEDSAQIHFELFMCALRKAPNYVELLDFSSLLFPTKKLQTNKQIKNHTYTQNCVLLCFFFQSSSWFVSSDLHHTLCLLPKYCNLMCSNYCTTQVHNVLKSFILYWKHDKWYCLALCSYKCVLINIVLSAKIIPFQWWEEFII